MTGRRVAWLLLLLAAVGGSWLLSQREPREPQLARNGLEPEPGYYLRGASILGLDPAGAPLYELRAGLVRQTPRSEEIALEDIEIDYTGGEQTPWRLDADSGHISDDGAIIVLTGNVLLRRAGAAQALLETTRLDVEVYEQVARTDAPVQLRDGRQVLTADGLLANLNSETLRLQSSVRGRFLPPR